MTQKASDLAFNLNLPYELEEEGATLSKEVDENNQESGALCDTTIERFLAQMTDHSHSEFILDIPLGLHSPPADIGCANL